MREWENTEYNYGLKGKEPIRRKKVEAKIPFRGRVGNSELREREEPWVRRGRATFLQNGKGVRGNRSEGWRREVIYLSLLDGEGS